MLQVECLAHGSLPQHLFFSSHFRNTDGESQISISFRDVNPIVI